MNLNISYNANTLSSAPSAFFSAVNYVVTLFDTTFTNNVTVNIEIGYGTFPYDNTAVPPLAESIQNNLVFANYSQVGQALLNDGAPGANILPSFSPRSGALVLGSAQERALGLTGPSNALDGYLGIASDATLSQQLGASWSFSPSATPGSNQYYLVGALEHEISEVMGRTSYLDVAGEYGVMDLYRYKAAGVRQTGAGSPAYFSINGGATNLDNFNTKPTGDLSDWAASAGADAFLAFNPAGQINAFTTTDLTLMAALGWTTGGLVTPLVSPPPPPPPPPVLSPPPPPPAPAPSPPSPPPPAPPTGPAGKSPTNSPPAPLSPPPPPSPPAPSPPAPSPPSPPPPPAPAPDPTGKSPTSSPPPPILSPPPPPAPLSPPPSPPPAPVSPPPPPPYAPPPSIKADEPTVGGAVPAGYALVSVSDPQRGGESIILVSDHKAGNDAGFQTDSRVTFADTGLEQVGGTGNYNGSGFADILVPGKTNATIGGLHMGNGDWADSVVAALPVDWQIHH
jgi:hypothetical protein